MVRCYNEHTGEQGSIYARPTGEPISSQELERRREIELRHGNDDGTPVADPWLELESQAPAAGDCVYMLERYGDGWRPIQRYLELLYGYGGRTIGDLERLLRDDREGLLRIRGVGPAILEKLDGLVSRWRKEKERRS